MYEPHLRRIEELFSSDREVQHEAFLYIPTPDRKARQLGV